MRSLRVLVAAVVAVFGMVALSYAAPFASVSKSTITATVTFTGSGIVWARAYATGSMTWSGVTPQATNWKVADGYITLFSTITAANAGIQIYTDNTASDAVVRYPGVAANAGGLVTTSSATAVLPMCWRMLDTPTTTTLTIGQTGPYTGEAAGTIHLVDPATPLYPCYFWMLNRGKFTDGDDYVTVKDSNRGMHGAEGDTWFTGVPSPDYIYLGANFSTALTSTSGVQYGATMRVEVFTE